MIKMKNLESKSNKDNKNLTTEILKFIAGGGIFYLGYKIVDNPERFDKILEYLKTGADYLIK